MVSEVDRQLSDRVDIISANVMSCYFRMFRGSKSLIGWAAV